ncbi:MAG: hypothetical protein WDO14_18875 [Bacteroidota bacterium]
MTRISLLLCLLFVTFNSFAQVSAFQPINRGQDYIIVNDSLRQGKVRPYGKGRIVLQEYETQAGIGAGGTVYNLSRISEYKRGSDIYEALTINGDRRMYVRLAKGNTSLYKRNGHFFLKSNDQLTELRRSNFRSTLASSLTCEGKEGSISNVVFSKQAMTGIVQRSNAGTCNLDRYPYRKLGIFVGYNLMNLKLYETQSEHSDLKASVPSVGIFYEAPLVTNLPWLYGSLEAFMVLPYKVEATFNVPGQTNRLVMTYNQIVATPGVKVTTTGTMPGLYVNLAPAISFTHAEAPEGVTSGGKKVSNVNPEHYKQLGYSASLGIQFPLSNRKNIHVELKHFNAGRYSDSAYEMQSTTTSLLVGFSL